MVAKEYFSWTALLLADTKHLEGEELLETCGRDISVLQAAVDFYDIMGCDKTIYLAYTLMLIAQSNAQLGNTLAAFEQYLWALNVVGEVTTELPSEAGLTDGFQARYRALSGRDVSAGVRYLRRDRKRRHNLFLSGTDVAELQNTHCCGTKADNVLRRQRGRQQLSGDMADPAYFLRTNIQPYS